MFVFEDLLNLICQYKWYSHLNLITLPVPDKYYSESYSEKKSFKDEQFRVYSNLSWNSFVEDGVEKIYWGSLHHEVKKRVKDYFGFSAKGYWVYAQGTSYIRLVKFEDKHSAYKEYRRLKQKEGLDYAPYEVLYIDGIRKTILPNGTTPKRPLGYVSAKELLLEVAKTVLVEDVLRSEARGTNLDSAAERYFTDVMESKFRLHVKDSGIYGEYGFCEKQHNKVELEKPVRKGWWVYKVLTVVDDYFLYHFDDKDEALALYENLKEKSQKEPPEGLVVYTNLIEML